MSGWDDLRSRQRVELGVVQVDIVSNSTLPGSDYALQMAKAIFSEHMQGIVERRQGKLMTWNGDGGAFIFLPGENGEGFHALGFSAVQMLTTLPAIHEEIAIRTNLHTPFAIRISCDVMLVNYHTNPGLIHAPSLNRFFQRERAISDSNTVTITERVWQQLPDCLQQKFEFCRYSTEVEASLYRYSYQRYLGVQEIVSAFPDERFKQDMAGAQKVRILNTWMPNLESFGSALETAVKRGADVKILLLHPESNLAARRSQALRGSGVSDVKDRIERNLSDLAKMYHRIASDRGQNNQNNLQDNLQVFIYDSLPSVSMYQINERIFVGTFFHGRLAIEAPQFVVYEAHPGFGQCVTEEFNTLLNPEWRIKHLPCWRREVNLMRS